MENIAVEAVKPEEATASRVSILVPPANFHQAAHAVVLDDAQPASIRCVALFGSAIIAGAQLMVLMAAYRSHLEGSCLDPVQGIDDEEEHKELNDALGSLGFSDDDKSELFKVIAGILQLGNTDFKAATVMGGEG